MKFQLIGFSSCFHLAVQWQLLSSFLLFPLSNSHVNFKKLSSFLFFHHWCLDAESSNKIIRSITWNRSTLSRSSSSKSLLTSSSISSSMWTEFKTDLFDDYGLDAGSHSLTLERLYAWEKKLHQELKVNASCFELYANHFNNSLILKCLINDKDTMCNVASN